MYPGEGNDEVDFGSLVMHDWYTVYSTVLEVVDGGDWFHGGM